MNPISSLETDTIINGNYPEHSNGPCFTPPSLNPASSPCFPYTDLWPPDTVLWSSGPSSIGEKESLGSLVKQPDVMSASVNLSSVNSRRVHQLGTKVEMVYSLLSMLGTHDREDMSKTLLAMSNSKESCIAMRQSGCLPLLVQLLHGDDPDNPHNFRLALREARKHASLALHNIVHAHPDDKRGRREARVLRLLEQIRDYCDQLRDLDVDVAYNPGPDQHPGPAIAALMKLSFDEEHRHAMCQLGGLQAIAELIQVNHEIHGNTNDQHCVTLRRYAGMALTNLTFGDGTNKAMLCSMKPFMKALVAQLHSPSEDLRQVTASVLRNLSWRADSTSKYTLRDVGAVTTLTKAAMEATKESILKSILSALWNLSAHCTANKADICAVDGALYFLVGTLTYKSISKTLAIVENGGGILRNISSHIAIREDYRAILRQQNCLLILLQHLKSPSLTVVSNACGTLWNLSARSAIDQQSLWEMGAVGMLRNLVHSKHKMISMGSSAALRNLLSFKPVNIPLENPKAVSTNLPSLLVRKQKALEAELDHNLSETCDNLDSPKTSPTPQPAESQFTFVGSHPIPYLPGRMYRSLNGSVPRSDSKDSIKSTHSEPLYYGFRNYHMFSKNLKYLTFEQKPPFDCKSYFLPDHLSNENDSSNIPECLTNNSPSSQANLRESTSSKRSNVRHSYPQSTESNIAWQETSSLRSRRRISERDGSSQQNSVPMSFSNLSSLSSLNSFEHSSYHSDFSHRVSDAMSPPISPSSPISHFTNEPPSNMIQPRPTWPIPEEEDDEKVQEDDDELSSPDKNSGPSSPDLSPDSPISESDDDDVAIAMSPPPSLYNININMSASVSHTGILEKDRSFNESMRNQLSQENMFSKIQSSGQPLQDISPSSFKSKLPYLTSKNNIDVQLVREQAQTILMEINKKVAPPVKPRNTHNCGFNHGPPKQRIHTTQERSRVTRQNEGKYVLAKAEARVEVSQFVPCFPAPAIRPQSLPLTHNPPPRAQAARVENKKVPITKVVMLTDYEEKGKEDERDKEKAQKEASNYDVGVGESEMDVSSLTELPTEIQLEAKRMAEKMEADVEDDFTFSSISDIDNMKPPSVMGDLACLTSMDLPIGAQNMNKKPKSINKPKPEALRRVLACNGGEYLDNLQLSSGSVENLSIKSSISDILENVNPPSAMDEVSIAGSYTSDSISSDILESHSGNEVAKGQLNGNSEMFERFNAAAAMVQVYSRELNNIMTGSMKSSGNSETIDHVKPPSAFQDLNEVTAEDRTEFVSDTMASDIEEDLPHDDSWNVLPKKKTFRRVSKTYKNNPNSSFSIPPDPVTTNQESLNLEENANVIHGSHTHRTINTTDMLEDEMISLVSAESEDEECKQFNNLAQHDTPSPKRGPRIVKPINKETIRQMQEKKNAENCVKSIRGQNPVRRTPLFKSNSAIVCRSAPSMVKPTKTSALRASQNQKLLASSPSIIQKPPSRQNSFPRETCRPIYRTTRSYITNKENFSEVNKIECSEEGIRPKPPMKQGTFTKDKPSQNGLHHKISDTRFDYNEGDDTASGTSDSRTSTPSGGSRGSVIRLSTWNSPPPFNRYSSKPIKINASQPDSSGSIRKLPKAPFFKKEVASKIASLWKKPSGNSSDPEKTIPKSQSGTIPTSSSVSRSSTYEKLSQSVSRPVTLVSSFQTDKKHELSSPASAIVSPFNYNPKPLTPSRIPSPTKPHTPLSPCLITMV